MTTLTIQHDNTLLDFVSSAKAQKITAISISHCRYLSGLSDLSRFRNLTSLRISYCKSYRREPIDISVIGSLVKLQRLNLMCLPRIASWFSFGGLRDLRQASFTSMITDLPSLHGIERLRKLEHLGLSRIKVHDDDPEPIIGCQSLKRVFWVGAPMSRAAKKAITSRRPDIVLGGNLHNSTT